MSSAADLRYVCMPDPTIDLLRNLIAIDSVNPSLAPGAVGETEIAHTS